MSHTGRPIIRQNAGGVSVLCPLGHSITWIDVHDWAGSQWEAKLGDRKFTVTCDGAVPLVRCDMRSECEEPVTMIDNKGFVYCTGHGTARRGNGGVPCRKLRQHELRRINRGQTVARY